ncbi:MAG: hypothetical protein HFG62_09620 [Lachnospiraceae bacterium]|nr:hypothetical protein [Lachnospiraceae bacterium]MCI8959361.1 hypothetical protein [Lachnospiraceae bacterium]MCI9102902.1 hypothetical protein [Lachnospiraceae bacterium]
MRSTKKYAAVLAAALTMSIWSGMAVQAGEWNFVGPEEWQWEYQDDAGNRAGAGWKEIDGSWYHFDENGYLDIGYRRLEQGGPWYYLSEANDANIGKMVTSGEWEFGHIQQDGSFYRLIPMLDGNGGVVLCDYSEENGFQQVKPSTLGWYNDIYVNLATWEPEYELEENRQFQLPADWKTACPNPLLDAMISGGNYSRYKWSVSDDNLLTVTAYFD